MTQTKSNTLYNEIRFEFHPSKLPKCGEVRINDCCTNAYLFCAFCCNYDDTGGGTSTDAANKFFTTLQEFVDHIRWHRSDDFDNSPVMQNGITTCIGFDGIEDDSRSDVLSAPPPIRETEFLTDWIAPPEELFESNIIGNFIEMEPQLQQNDTPVTKQQMQQTHQHQPEDDMPELTGEVFIELVDLYKKCPCLWHKGTIAATSPETIDRVYKFMTAHFNRVAQQSKSEDFVRLILKQIKNCFVDEYKRVSQEGSDPPSWYFPYLSFVLDCDSQQLDKSVFTDFKCPVCMTEHVSQEDLWNHIASIHLEPSTKPPVDDARTIPDIAMAVEHQAPQTELDINKVVSNRNEHLKCISMPTFPFQGSTCEYPSEVVDKFIDLYRSQKCLWDKNNKEYDCCLMRQKSYDLLLTLLQEHDPNSTFDDVDRRISDLPEQFFTSSSSNNNETVLNNGSETKDKSPVLENGFADAAPPAAATNHVHVQTENMTKKNISTARSQLPQREAQPANFYIKITTGSCPICNASFNEQSTWLSHLELAHTSEEYMSKDGFFYCTVCGWQNKTKKLLVRHYRYRHSNNLQACTECNMTFRFLSMLVRHRIKVHKDKNPFKCESCGEGFPSRSLMRLHVKSHKSSLKRSLLCVQCGNEFTEWKAFNSHVTEHKLDKKECRLCQKKLSSLTELRKHVCTHVNLLAHKCDKCGRVFRSAKFLSKHLNNLHNHATNSSNHLIRSKAKRHKPAIITTATNQCSQASCDVCGTKFFRKSSLLKHKRLKHNQISEIS